MNDRPVNRTANINNTITGIFIAITFCLGNAPGVAAGLLGKIQPCLQFLEELLAFKFRLLQGNALFRRYADLKLRHVTSDMALETSDIIRRCNFLHPLNMSCAENFLGRCQVSDALIFILMKNDGFASMLVGLAIDPYQTELAA